MRDELSPVIEVLETLDAPIDAAPEAIAWRGADPAALAAVCAELGIAPASLNLPAR